ncbi:MAG TPA: TadA family conjugal transfer-associated ATPase [Phycicoccus sp.]|jgi:pilus assembly protein CpaF|nr:TadA family conjugal transfer-associated ATPase [Phycicoccus sp.]HQH06895.1 TadA family conjugal transfer-associated ATPase [Phycicoccus sp.]HQK31221.1 TadA family conjugal transfer-associated ATPase [Phycicoccus sp.]HQY96213.1 TadA family conjugal transfer-associated ATPase [Phycicoccus sp.]HRA44354.1 TadA family conjugal transfer-associated ATPase [Phycicoccus sp.]
MNVPTTSDDPTASWSAEISALVSRGSSPTRGTIDDLVQSKVARLGSEGVDSQRRLLESRLMGMGCLAEELTDARVTDVLVNGDGSVWVDRGAGVTPTGRRLESTEARALAVRLAGQAGRRLDDAQPWVDGLLPGGIRLHAILPPLVLGGPHLSLRIPRVAPEGLAGLVRLGMLDEDCRPLVEAIIRARLSHLVVGGTGTGKTTLVGGLVAACPPTDRIVIVEDVRELAPRHGHCVHLQGRSPNVEGVGGVSMVDLVRQALRMRPDRLIVGEVRGAEVRELLGALNTGHAGGGGTLHANTVGELPARLEALGALAGMSARMVSTQLVGGVQVVFGMVREGPARRVSTIGVVTRDSDGRPGVQIAWQRPASGHSGFGSGMDTLTRLLAERRS